MEKILCVNFWLQILTLKYSKIQQVNFIIDDAQHYFFQVLLLKMARRANL